MRFLEYLMKNGLENLILTDEKDRREQWTTYLVSLSKRIAEQGVGEMAKTQKLIRTRKDKKLQRAMITNVRKGHGA